MKEILGDRILEVKPSRRLKKHPVCLTSGGDISIEMEKVLNQMPNNEGIKADKILEINIDHPAFKALEQAKAASKEEFSLYTKLLYDQALLIEGLPIDDPVEFADNIWKLLK